MLANPEETMKCGQAKRTSPAAFSNSYIHVVDATDRFLLYTDLPGVKVEDLKVELTNEGVLRVHGERRKKGEESAKFDRRFHVDDQLIDGTKITARLSDGTLEIVVTKRKASKPRRVAVVAGTPTNDESVLSFEVDVPGVKVDALEVQVDSDGKLVISGERKRGGQAATIHRAFSLNRRTVDTDKLEAYLEDGVLAIRAPKKEPFVGRTIPVNSSSDAEETSEKEMLEQEKKDAAIKEKKDEKEVEEESNEKTKEEEEEEEEYHDVQTNPTEEEKSIDKLTDSSSEVEYEVVPETVTEDDE